MRVRKISGIVLMLLLTLGFVFLLGRPVHADENSATVKVGFFAGSGYAEQDADGKWSGIDIELIENIAQTAGFQISLVEEDSGTQGLADLESGKIDMLADIAKTPERIKNYLFSEQEQGSSGSGIFVRQDDERWDYGDISELKKMTFACEAETICYDEFISWAAQYDFKPDITKYDTFEEAREAVDKKEQDAFIEGEDFLEGYTAVYSFSPSPYYFAFAKDNAELKATVDTAMAQIYNENPLYEKELFEKYVGLTQERSISLTQTEKNYIASLKELRVAVLNHDEPYFYGNATAPKGIIPDFFAQIGSATGLTFSYRVYENQSDAIAGLKSGDVDLIGVYSEGMTNAFDLGMSITNKYTSVSTVMITRAGTTTENIRKIAVKDRSRAALQKNLPTAMQEKELLSYNTAADCFLALQQRKADAVIIGLPSATYLINQTNASAYSVSPVTSASLELCCLTARSDLILRSVLNKGIHAESYVVDGIVANNTISKGTFQTAIAKIPPVYLVAFAMTMFLLVLFLIWAVASLTRSRKTKVAAVEAEAKAEEQRIRAEEAEKSATEKNAFFSNISHDMRTPLNAVIGFAGLAQKEENRDKKNEYLEKIQTSGKLLNSLIDDTLTLSKVNSGKLVLHPEVLNTEVLGDSITAPIRTIAAQKKITFQIDKSGYRPRMIYADPLNLQKIFLNLLTNAVKYTPEGGKIWVKVWDEPKDAEEPVTCFAVRDNGIGISREFLPHVFEPFSQEKRHGYESVGTGLGLSIVKQLVEVMHGSITAESTVGEGTTFTVRLKLENAPASAVKEESPQTEKDWSILRGKKILLCEDNAMNREIASALLADRGMTAVCAENGQKGVEIFTDSTPGEFAAIIMDVRMPVMDGLEATKNIRLLNRPDAQKIPVIAMTADAFADDIRKCREAGMNAHVAKPIDPEKLYEVLTVSCKDSVQNGSEKVKS